MGRFEVFQKRDGLLLAEISFAILSVLCKLIPQTALDDPSESDQIHVDHSVTSRKPY